MTRGERARITTPGGLTFANLDLARAPSDAQLLRAAIDASGLPDVRFAEDVLGVNDRTLRTWLGGRPLDRSATVRVVCAAIVDDPPLAARLAGVLDELRARNVVRAAD